MPRLRARSEGDGPLGSPDVIDPIDLLSTQGVALPPIGIVDVGSMRIGQDPWDRLVARGVARVVGFDPQADASASGPQAETGRCISRYALGDGKTWPFHHCAAPMTSSMLPPNLGLAARFNQLADLMRVVEIVQMPTRRLDDVLDPASSDLLKLDVQGLELVVLKNGARTLESTLLVQCEVSFIELYQGQPLFAEIDQFLRTRGFSLHTFLGLASRTYQPLLVNGDPGRGLRQVIWSDAVFVRDPGAWCQLAPEALLKLSVLLHCVYGSPDLAARALWAHDIATGSALQKPYLAALCGGPAPPRAAALPA